MDRSQIPARTVAPVLSRRRLSVVSALLLVIGLCASPAAAADEPLLTMGPSDADSVVVSSGAFDVSGGPGTPGWWDHTDLTVAVAAAPSADPVLTRAIHDAIATWSSVLTNRLPVVSLTDVTSGSPRSKNVDIVVHFVPKAGGFSWGGQSVCGYQRCLNVMIRSDLIGLDQSINGEPDFDATRVYRMAVHELGHALGLGHASPLETSTDIMGYGWGLPDPDVTPILSDCDIEGIAAAFAWAVNGEAPHPATVDTVVC